SHRQHDRADGNGPLPGALVRSDDPSRPQTIECVPAAPWGSCALRQSREHAPRREMSMPDSRLRNTAIAPRRSRGMVLTALATGLLLAGVVPFLPSAGGALRYCPDGRRPPARLR